MPKRALRGLLCGRRKREAFEPPRVAMRFRADGTRSAEVSSLLSLNRGRSPATLGIRARLAPCVRSRPTRRRRTIRRTGPPLSFILRSSDFHPRGLPSHRVQTASPKLSGLVHRRLPLGDASSIARDGGCRIDFARGVGNAGFSSEMRGIELTLDVAISDRRLPAGIVAMNPATVTRFKYGMPAGSRRSDSTLFVAHPASRGRPAPILLLRYQASLHWIVLDIRRTPTPRTTRPFLALLRAASSPAARTPSARPRALLACA